MPMVGNGKFSLVYLGGDRQFTRVDGEWQEVDILVVDEEIRLSAVAGTDRARELINHAARQIAGPGYSVLVLLDTGS